MQDDVLEVENFRNDTFEGVKEEWDHFPEEVITYQVVKENLLKTLLRIEVVIKSMTWSIVNLKRTVILLGMEKRLSMKAKEETLSSSSR